LSLLPLSLAFFIATSEFILALAPRLLFPLAPRRALLVGEPIAIVAVASPSLIVAGALSFFLSLPFL